MAEDTGASAANGAIWAVTTLLIVLIVLAVLFFSGVFSNKKSIDINVNRPGMVLSVGGVGP